MHSRYVSIEKNITPGVGSYNLGNLPNLKHKLVTKISFSKELRYRSVHEIESKHKPGVGSYNVGIDMKNRAPKIGFGTAKRPNMVAKDVTPAPG
jgi:hypothetical protein